MRSPRYSVILIGLVSLVALPAMARASSVVSVDQGICLDCHDDISDQMARPVQHPPARDEDCSACHNPHAGKNAALLLEQPAILCAECHSDIQRTLAKPFLHDPVARGRCGDCHQPHGGDHEGLLSAPSSQICAGCHTEIETWAAKSVQHSPFSQGRCSACHDPHGGDHPGLADSAPGRLCSSCHSTDAGFLARHNGYPVHQASCNQCHDPHASNQRGLFRETVHPPFEDGDCSTCHLEPGIGDRPFAVNASQDELCGSCHPESVDASQTTAFPHVSGGGATCTACHNPHSGQGSGMLTQETQLLCLGCHDPGGAKSGGEGLFVTHGDELGCETCHASHGGERPLFFVENSIELCGNCHSHQHAIAHPVGEETVDPRNETAMDCLSCHGIHAASHDKFLHMDGERKLCIACHKDKGGL